jgi:hypothetical protein
MGMPVRGTHAALEDLLFDPEQLGQGSFDSLGRHRGPELTSLLEIELYKSRSQPLLLHYTYACVSNKRKLFGVMYTAAL